MRQSWQTYSKYNILADSIAKDKLWMSNAMEIYIGIAWNNLAPYFYSDVVYRIAQYAKKAIEGTSTSSSAKNIAYKEDQTSYYWWMRTPTRSLTYAAGAVNSLTYNG